MPKFGVHAFLWIGQWTTKLGNQAINEAAAAGFDLIEIPLLDPKEFNAAAHKRVLRDAGIAATASLVLPPGAHMPEHPARAKRFLIQALTQVEALGATFLGGCTAYELGKLTGKPPTRKERRTVVDTLREVAAEGKKRGITVGLECCNRYETYLYNTVADGRDAVKAIGADNVTLHLDTYHMNIEEVDFYQPLVEAADVLGYIHLSESHRGLVGNGTVQWDQVFRGLVDAKYRGPLVLESFPVFTPAMAGRLCLWRTPPPPDQPPAVLGREALTFLRTAAARFGVP